MEGELRHTNTLAPKLKWLQKSRRFWVDVHTNHNPKANQSIAFNQSSSKTFSPNKLKCSTWGFIQATCPIAFPIPPYPAPIGVVGGSTNRALPGYFCYWKIMAVIFKTTKNAICQRKMTANKNEYVIEHQGIFSFAFSETVKWWWLGW